MGRLLLVFIFLSLSAWSEDNSLINGIHFLTQLESESLAPRCQEPTKDQKIKLCVQELCGTPINVSSIFDSAWETSTIKKISANAEERADISRELKTALSQRKIEIDKVYDLYANGKLKPLTNGWDDTAWEREASQLFNDYVKIEVNKTAPVNERIKISLSDNKEIPSELVNGLREWMLNYEKHMKKEEVLFQLQAISEIEARDIIKSKWSRLDPKVKIKIQEFKGLSFLKSIDDDLNNMNLNELNSTFQLLEAQSGTISLGVSNWCASSLCREAIGNSYNKKALGDVIAEWKNDAKSEVENVEQLVEGCLARVNITEEYQERIAMIQNILPDIQQNFVNKWATQTCPKIDLKLKTYLASLNYDFSIKDKTGGLRTILDNLKNEMISSREPLENFMEWKKNYGPFESIKDLCRFNGSYDQDKFDGENNTLVISPFSCQHPVGVETINHELGHALSFFLQRISNSPDCQVQYEKTRKCVSSRHAAAAAKFEFAAPFKGDTGFSEEDMADYMSAIVSPKGSELRSCSMLDHRNLDPEKHYEPPSRSGDMHSPPFARLIFELLDKGQEIPSSCKETIESMPQYKWTSCR